jgi:hypothetical protein
LAQQLGANIFPSLANVDNWLLIMENFYHPNNNNNSIYQEDDLYHPLRV